MLILSSQGAFSALHVIWLSQKMVRVYKWTFKVCRQGQVFGIVVKMPIRTSACIHIREPGCSPGNVLDSSFLLMHTLGGSWSWLQWLSPCQPRGRLDWVCGSSFSPALAVVGIWEVNQWMSLCLYLSKKEIFWKCKVYEHKVLVLLLSERHMHVSHSCLAWFAQSRHHGLRLVSLECLVH